MLKKKDMYIDYKKSKRVDYQKRGNKTFKKSILAICLILMLFAFLGGGYLFIQGKFPVTLSDIPFKLNDKTNGDISEDKIDFNLNLFKNQYTEYVQV
jgi:hypothetical protein